MKVSDLNLKKSSPNILRITIDPDIEIPDFEEAFNPSELKKFYKDRDSTSTFSPKSSISPGKNTPTHCKDQENGNGSSSWPKESSFQFKVQSLKGLNESDDQTIDLWKLTKNVGNESLKIQVTNENNQQIVKATEIKVKVKRKQPFIIVRDTNKKVKCSNEISNGCCILNNDTEDKTKLHGDILKKVVEKIEIEQVKPKKVVFLIQRKANNNTNDTINVNTNRNENRQYLFIQ